MSDEAPIIGEHIYCPKCRCLHVDLGEWSKKNHPVHLCERCGEEFDTGRKSVGINLPYIKEADRSPHKCGICHATYRTRGSLEEGEIPVRNVCVCEVTAKCDTCGAGFVVQRDLFDEQENPKYRCRGCAKGLIDKVLAPVARTGPPDLHDIDEHLEYYIKRDKRRLLCESCEKVHGATKSAIDKNVTQGYLFGCPYCGATELVLAIPAPEPVVVPKKVSVHWRRRTRRPVAEVDVGEGDE